MTVSGAGDRDTRFLEALQRHERARLSSARSAASPRLKGTMEPLHKSQK
jgi:hypothetical protein